MYSEHNQLKKIPALILLALALTAACSKSISSPSIRFPYAWIGEKGYGGYLDLVDFPEPSGICYHPSRETLFVVSDEGQIAEVDTEGTIIFRQPIPGDLEGVTVNPETGLLYVAKEGEDVILEFDPEIKEVTRMFTLNRSYQDQRQFLAISEGHDNGIESISFVADQGHPEGGTFYVGNQWDPSCILEVYVPLRTNREKSAEARILRVLPLVMDDPSAMYFDSKTGLLNVGSDADNILVEITLEGKIVREYAFIGNSQEGIARDEEGYLYIAQDSGGLLKVKDLR